MKKHLAPLKENWTIKVFTKNKFYNVQYVKDNMVMKIHSSHIKENAGNSPIRMKKENNKNKGKFQKWQQISKKNKIIDQALIDNVQELIKFKEC